MEKIFSKMSKFAVSVILIILALFISILIFSSGSAAYADSTNIITIQPNAYDTYTNSDSLLNNPTKNIRNYPTDSTLYRSTSTITRNNGQFNLSIIGDDPIVQIIPKELFINRGVYTYIGKEYGFYVNTFADVYYYKDDNNVWHTVTSNNNNHSIVMVFDITTLTDLVATIDQVIITIQPIFQYEFVYISPNETLFTLAKNSGESPDNYQHRVNYSVNSGYVLPSCKVNSVNGLIYEQINKYYLKDISFGGTLANEQELNQGNSNYNPYNDIGTYITGYDYKYQGLTLENGEIKVGEHIDFWVNEIAYVLGWIPGLSYGVSVISNIATLPGMIIDNVNYFTNTINQNRPELVNINNGQISATNFYSNRDDQLQYYRDESGHPAITKSAAIVVNTNDDRSIWYSIDNSASVYFKVNHSALNGQNPNYTRFQRDIGLWVVSEDGQADTSAISTYNYFLREPVNKQLKISENPTDNMLYLLPQGRNNFAFTPEFTSYYNFNIGAPGQLNLKIGSNTTTGNNFNMTFYRNNTYQIEIYGNTNALTAPISITPSTSLNGININSQDSYIIKTALTQVKVLDTSTDGVNINAIKKFNGSSLADYTFYGVINPSKTVSYPFASGNYYIIINNTTGSAKTVNLSVTEPSAITLNTNKIVAFTSNYTYMKFVTDASGGRYIFTVSGSSTGSLQGKTVNQNVTNSPTGTAISAIGTYDIQLSGNTTYFIGLTNNISGQENVTVKVNKSDTAYKWKINSTTYTTNEPLYLTRGASYTVKFYINDVLCNTPIYPEVIAPHTNIFGGYGNTTLIDGVLTIPANAPVGGSGLYINALSQLDPDADIRHKLTIVPSISSTISFSGAYHSANDMGFKWIHQKYINSVTYTLTRGSVTISGLVRGNLYNTAHDTILSESILARAIASFSSLTGNITVTITSINYRTALGTYVDLGMSRSLSFNPSYAGGSGTASSPYQLTNAFHVNEIRNRTSSRFALMNNISLSAYSNWQPIPYFYGGINGNNYTLQNLKIIVPTTSYSEYQKFGLIGSNSGTIENLKFSNVSLLGSPLHSGAWVYLAAVAGYNNAGGVIKYVYVQGQIELHRTYSRVGGIAGANFGLIEHCDFGNNSVQSLIKGNGDLGGISGSNQGTVTYCNLYYSNIESYITYSNRNIGGIIGYCYNSGMISYSNVYNSEIRNIGWDNNLSDLAPCMGIIVGQIVDSYLWYVGRSNAGVSTGSLNSTQRRYCATGYWGESGYRSNTDVK